LRTLEFEPAPSAAIAAAQQRVSVYVGREALSVLLALRPELRSRDAKQRAQLEPYCAMIAGAQARAARWWLDNENADRDETVARVVDFIVAAVGAIQPAP
jgi:hypothetical protein